MGCILLIYGLRFSGKTPDKACEVIRPDQDQLCHDHSVVERFEIGIYHLIEGAKQADGLTVVIDVFRAFSLECLLMAKGAAAIHPVGKVEEAFALKEEHPDWILFGERRGARVEGFAFGNSPTQCMDADVTGRTIVHTTGAGTVYCCDI